MKTVHRAILGELLVTFALAVAALNLVVMTEKLLRLTKVLAAVGASMGDMAVIVLYLQPQIMVLTMPTGLLLATLLTYGRLNADSELTALRACGMPFDQIARPVLVLGTACFLGGLALSLVVAPAGSRAMRDTVSRVVAERAPSAIEEGVFSTALKDVVLFVREKPEPDELRGVFLHDDRREDRPVVLFARSGRVSSSSGESVRLTLRDGSIHLVRGDAATNISFGRYSLNVPVDVSNPAKLYHELSVADLLREARDGKDRDRARMILELHRRFSLPAVCLVLMFFGPPLALRAGKTGRLGGLALGLTVFATYYAALTYGEGLVRAGRLPHWAGAWGPPLALGAVALMTFRRETAR